jgi:hypothetical protein
MPKSFKKEICKLIEESKAGMIIRSPNEREPTTIYVSSTPPAPVLMKTSSVLDSARRHSKAAAASKLNTTSTNFNNKTNNNTCLIEKTKIYESVNTGTGKKQPGSILSMSINGHAERYNAQETVYLDASESEFNFRQNHVLY